MQTGRGIVERGNQGRTRKRDAEKEQKRLEAERAKAEARRTELQDGIADWDKQWSAAIDGLPVPGGAKPDAVQEVVELLDEIAADSEQINGLIHRIETMQRDDQEYSTEVGKIADRSGIALEDADALIMIKKLHHAATAAKQNEENVVLHQTLASDPSRAAGHGSCP